MTDEKLTKHHRSNKKAVTWHRERQNEKRKVDSAQVILQGFKTPQSVGRNKQRVKNIYQNHHNVQKSNFGTS